jgi:hypothetical protein
MMSTGLAFDQVGGRALSSASSVSGASGQAPAEIDQPVDRQHADAASIGQHRQPVAAERLDPAQRLHRVEQFIQVKDAQQPGPTEGGVVNLVDSGQCPGMGGGRLGGFGVPSGLDDDDRLRPSGRRAPPT